MAQVYSTQLIADTISEAESATYDVTEGFIVVVRDISGSVLIPRDASGGGTLAVAIDGISIATWYFPVDVYETIHWEGRALTSPGPTTVTASATGGCVAELVVSGYLLTLP